MMDHVEKWIVDQHETLQHYALAGEAILVLASRWHDEGEAVLALQYGEDVADDELFEQIAIGVHTGLRKGSEAPSSATLWRAINVSDDGAWGDAVRFCVSGLRSMGYRVMRVKT